MNGAHDLGGAMGFGPVEPEPEDVRFHADWEPLVLALTLAAARPGGWSIDESRHARESLPPPLYLNLTYYEIWLAATEKLLVAHGLVGDDELASGRSLRPGVATPAPLGAAETAEVLATGAPTLRDEPAGPRFAPGDRVRARVVHPRGHTRLPRYVRGRCGVVETRRGAHVLPDSRAHGHGEAPEQLYTVVFTGPELWGPDADPTSSVSVDAWESYLEPA
ncbi:Cobalt-containing nitrile hydratase subunit beta [Pseudonocardia sp. Ae168_Ps1]|uniref:nitrile hydratase subunit beta n=1 Tax=unclassified Pseudonocardia TaxID=2619320 RepID=UPI0001FFE8A1|nr:MULTISPECIES: nitrile hydratase subunit beta [unclassified Pseudonocardia]OLL75646.1 Cobalt-containing nitrile hydratase subunit beta [Pseudonocardia sp. Ae150A_Ps1]OLL81645.1 Cobalt-containing nitrile hydratase subunit beta [Pseudonocardia sp. Ae168_Ps1]OLM16416.1 Cobalt-containing nitrile hydratase subunit beta [Pseudonocardia sp. Ae707_Ps1]